MRDEPKELEDLESDQEDDFDKIYKGEISKSGTAILPSKRVRRMPEKVIIAKEEVDPTEENVVEKEEAEPVEEKEEAEPAEEKETPEENKAE